MGVSTVRRKSRAVGESLKKHGVQARERRRRREHAEVEQELVLRQRRPGARALQQRDELLVRIPLAQRVLRLAGRHLLRDARAVLRVEVVAERREDEAVQCGRDP